MEELLKNETIIGALIALAGVLIGLLFNAAKELLIERKQTKKRATYLAARIVCVLDEYIEKCCKVVGDDGTDMGQPAGRTENGEEYCEPQALLPKPPIYPDDVDWKSIDGSLMYRILALPNHARETDGYIIASGEHACPPDYEEVFEARQEGYAELGLEAIELIDLLRKEYDLPEKKPNKWNPEWSNEALFRDKLKQIEQRRAQYKDLLLSSDLEAA